MKLQFLDVQSPKDIETAFRAATKGRAEGVLVLTGPVINAQRNRLQTSQRRAGFLRYIHFQNM